MKIQVALNPKILTMDINNFIEESIFQISREGKVEHIDTNPEQGYVTFEVNSLRDFERSWIKFGARIGSCAGVWIESSNRLELRQCLNHEKKDPKCYFYYDFNPDELPENITVSTPQNNENEPKQQSRDQTLYLPTDHLPEFTAISKSIDRRILPFMLTLISSVFPILQPIEGESLTSILGTGFYIKFSSNKYLVTAKHNLLNDKGDGLDDYLIGFEGKTANEIYYLSREKLIKKGATWSWIEYDPSSGIKLDVMVTKVAFSDEAEDLLNIKPYTVNLTDFRLGPGDYVYTFGYPLGHGQRLSNFIMADTGETVISETDLMTLLPHIFTGRVISSGEKDQIFQVISNMAVAHGLSGSPLYYLDDQEPKLLGINFKANVVKKPLDRMSSHKRVNSVQENYRYGNKLYTIHLGHILQLIRSEYVQKKDQIKIGVDDISVRARNSIINKGRMVDGR